MLTLAIHLWPVGSSTQHIYFASSQFLYQFTLKVVSLVHQYFLRKAVMDQGYIPQGLCYDPCGLCGCDVCLSIAHEVICNDQDTNAFGPFS